jgi:tetratricopeptide (TPR) repeat protein
MVMFLLCSVQAVPTATKLDLVQKGDAAFDRFDNSAALGYYEKAWELDKTDAELLARLTWTCNNVGEDLDSKKSEEYFEKAIAYSKILKEMDPENPRTWFLSAITSGNLGLYRGGKQKVTLSRHVAEDAQRSIDIDPDYAPAYVTLGVYYREVATLNVVLRTIAKKILGGLPSGTLEDSEKMLLTGIEKDPTSGYAEYQIAKTYEAMDENEKAILHYKKLLALPATDHQIPSFKEEAKKRIAKLGKS